MSDVFCDQREGKQTRTLGFLLLAVSWLPFSCVPSVSGWSLVTSVQTPGRLLTYHPGLSLFSRHVGWLLIKCAGLGSTALPRQPALGFKQQQQQSVSPASLLSDSLPFAKLHFWNVLHPCLLLNLLSHSSGIWLLSSLPRGAVLALLAITPFWLTSASTWVRGPVDSPPRPLPASVARQRGGGCEGRGWKWERGCFFLSLPLWPGERLEGSTHLGSAVEVEERSVGRPPFLRARVCITGFREQGEHLIKCAH